MVELNHCAPRPIKVLGPYTFSIGDTAGFHDYIRGGRVMQVKMPKIIHFKSLEESLPAPSFCDMDMAKFDRPPLLHLGYRALHEFKSEHGHFPRPGNATDITAYISLVNGLNDISMQKIDALDEGVLSLLASQSTTCLAPMCGVLGGIVAQEVMKACSGKFSPIQQYLYFDSLECMPASPIAPEQLQPVCKIQHV